MQIHLQRQSFPVSGVMRALFPTVIPYAAAVANPTHDHDKEDRTRMCMVLVMMMGVEPVS